MPAQKPYRSWVIMVLCLLCFGGMVYSGAVKWMEEQVITQTVDLGDENQPVQESGTEWEEESMYDHPGLFDGLAPLALATPVSDFLTLSSSLVYLPTQTPPPDLA
ncbi:MAG: hypothetical protein SFU20_10190 [Chitinophagaceae bacterium]|nr:hypothetical protein [Chitinophagaceae bacterium]